MAFPFMSDWNVVYGKNGAPLALIRGSISAQRWADSTPESDTVEPISTLAAARLRAEVVNLRRLTALQLAVSDAERRIGRYIIDSSRETDSYVKGQGRRVRRWRAEIDRLLSTGAEHKSHRSDWEEGADETQP